MEGYYTGRVSNTDTDKGLVQVTYPQQNNVVSDWLPLLAFEYNMPEVGALVATFLDKNGNGVCLGKIYSNSQPPEAGNQYSKDIDGVKIIKTSDEFVIKFNDDNYVKYSGGIMTIRADKVNIVNNIQ